MTVKQLILLYLVGGISCGWIGIQVEAWRWKKRAEHDIHRAYNRGWNAGQNHLDRISKQKTDLSSSMRILTGEEGYDDESFNQEE